MNGTALKLAEPMAGTPETGPARPLPARPKANLAWRWLVLHQQGLRALVIGAMSLGLFLLAWHLLTTYRVSVHVRFVNVPSPAMVFDSLMRAAHDPRFLSHVYLSCRRIFIGFTIAAIVAVPLGLVMGRFRLVREIVFPVCEVLRPIPAIAWVPMAIMLWPSNEESIVFITYIGSFFPILLNTLQGMSMVDPVLIRAAQCLGAREASIFREVYFPGRPALRVHRPDRRHGRRLGVVDRRRDDLRPVRDRLLHLGGLLARAVLRHRAGHDLHRRARPRLERADPRARPDRHAVGQDMTAPPPAAVKKGKVTVTDFSLSYDSLEGPVEAVCDASIRVDPGEFVSIIGPSGCGKSTLLNAVAGFLKPTRGQVAVDGEPVAGPSADRGMVFQQYSLFPWKTVRQNVEFGLKMKGIDASKRETSARTLLGLAGLLAFENQYPDRLSGGMKQRVGIIRALATGPKVLLLDEPFGSLDAQTRIIMQQILTNMWQHLKTSVLFVTHDIDEAIFLSDRVYCMTARPGRIKAEILVPLERPREQTMMMSSEFLALRRRLMSLIREESLKAMGGEINEDALQGLSIDLHGQSLADII